MPTLLATEQVTTLASGCAATSSGGRRGLAGGAFTQPRWPVHGAPTTAPGISLPFWHQGERPDQLCSARTS